MRALRPATLIGAMLLAGVVLNGIEPFLLRVGALEPDAYERAWSGLCGPAGITRAPLGLGARCNAYPDVRLQPLLWPENRARSTAHTLESSRLGRVLKLAKDACILVALGVAAWSAWRARRLPAIRARWPLAAHAALVALHSGLGLARGEVLPVLSGLRSFEILPLALLLPPLLAASLCGALTRWVTAGLVVQLPLLAVEALRSLPVQKVAPVLNLPWRLSGSLVMPNSLGVFAATALFFVLTFESARSWRIAATVAALACVAASGSGAGWVVLTAVAAWWLWSRGGVTARAAAVTVLLAMGVALPLLALRADVYDSLLARGEALRAAAAGRPAELLFGGALGAGTTTLATLDRAGDLGQYRRWWAGDSGLAALLAQAGVLGLLLAGCALAQSWRRDPPSRSVLLAVGLSALVIPVLDLFPVNLLLALVLGRSPAEVAAPNLGVT